jgi:hypothetical protein
MHLHRFKAFLDSVTPEEWFESLAASRAASKAALRGAWQAACDAVAARKAEAAAARQRAEHDMQWARTQQQYERAERAYREALCALREALALTVRGRGLGWPLACLPTPHQSLCVAVAPSRSPPVEFAVPCPPCAGPS